MTKRGRAKLTILDEHLWDLVSRGTAELVDRWVCLASDPISDPKGDKAAQRYGSFEQALEHYRDLREEGPKKARPIAEPKIEVDR